MRLYKEKYVIKNMKIPSRFPGRLFPYRIWQQVFIYTVFLVVIPLFILGSLLIRTSQKAIRTSIFQSHKELAIHTTGEIREYLKAPQLALNATASILGTLGADTWRQETSIVELALRYPAFNRISVLNLKGQETATSKLGTALVERSSEEAFIKAKAGEPFVSPVIISDAHVPLTYLSVPIKNLNRITGVLVAELNLRGAWNIVDSIEIGRTGRAYLIDGRGRLLSHPDKKLVLKNENITSPKIISDIIKGAAGSMEETDALGKGWLISYAPLDSLPWGLVIVQSTQEAYAFSNIMKMQSWALIVLSILAAVLISLILSRFMSQPINKLIVATQNIAKGNYDYHLRIHRKDEIGRLFRSFNGMTLRLKQMQRMEKLSTIGKAATAIAHELKNSLLLINTFIRLLPKRHKDKEFIDEFSKTVPQELDSWKNMLQNMVNYSKFLQFQMGEVDINVLIHDVAALAHQRAKQNGVDFIVNTDLELPKINGNVDKLKQVFLNLINNALEATREGGSIIMSTDFARVEKDESSYVRVKIEDTGEGLVEKPLDRIFDPFFTTKSNGLGLGLAVSKEIVEHHGGKIEAASRDKGSCFTVIIPVKNKE